MIEARDGVVALPLVREPSRPSRNAMDHDRLGALADDIAANGLYQKCGVRGPFADGTYELIWGHRRLLALRLLRWSDLPCMIYPPDYDPDVARIGENFNREELNPVEEAQECQRLIDKGLPRATVARLVRRSPAWVDGRLTLLAYPPDIRDAVAERELSLGVAAVLAQIDHDAVRADFVKEAKRTGAKTQTAEVWLYHYRADRDRIISNRLTVEQFVTERPTWILKIRCQLCEDEFPYTETQNIRACNPCIQRVIDLVEGQTRIPGSA
jgi:ParB/RepB/Spo0J family partition protein